MRAVIGGVEGGLGEQQVHPVREASQTLGETGVTGVGERARRRLDAGAAVGGRVAAGVQRDRAPTGRERGSRRVLADVEGDVERLVQQRERRDGEQRRQPVEHRPAPDRHVERHPGGARVESGQRLHRLETRLAQHPGRAGVQQCLAEREQVVAVVGVHVADHHGVQRLDGRHRRQRRGDAGAAVQQQPAARGLDQVSGAGLPLGRHSGSGTEHGELHAPTMGSRTSRGKRQSPYARCDPPMTRATTGRRPDPSRCTDRPRPCWPGTRRSPAWCRPPARPRAGSVAAPAR